MRLLRQGVAGLSQMGNSQAAANWRISAFVSSHSAKRTADLPLAAGLHAGAMFAAVVVVRAVADHGHAQTLGKLLDFDEQFGLAEVAAIAAIGLIAGNGQFVGLDHFVANADLPGKRDALFQLAARQACAHARHGHRPIAQGQLGRLGHDRAIQSAGEGHGATAVALQQCEQAVAFGGKIGREGGHGSWDGLVGISAFPDQPTETKKVLRRNAVAMGF